MTSISTKVIGVRVPLHEYMEILQTAADNKMTISDYALQLIYLNKAKPQGQTTLELERKCSVLEQRNTRLNREVESLKKSLKESEDNLEQVHDTGLIRYNEIEELKQKLAVCQKQVDSNQALITKLKKDCSILGSGVKNFIEFNRAGSHEWKWVIEDELIPGLKELLLEMKIIRP